MISDIAFIMAAGFGKRLRPYTDNMPKPMVEVGGMSLINHTINQLKDAGILKFIINSHYKAEILAEHLAKRTDVHITLSHEETLLDTGGGVKNVIKEFNGQDFFLLNGDGLWTNTPTSALDRMKAFWNPENMDILMLLQPISTMVLTKGVGDYTLNPDGTAQRSLDQTGTHMFTGIRITSSRIFENTPNTAFSYLKLMDEAQKNGRLYALEHDAMWHHISTPSDLQAVQAHWTGTSNNRANGTPG
jgi:MurNAc alpha-1-phosphate uridylyltransferase